MHHQAPGSTRAWRVLSSLVLQSGDSPLKQNSRTSKNFFSLHVSGHFHSVDACWGNVIFLAKNQGKNIYTWNGVLQNREREDRQKRKQIISLSQESKRVVNLMIVGSLSKDVVERRMSTRSGLFALLGRDFEQRLRQIISMSVKTLSNTNLVSSRHIKREKGSLPVDFPPSKTSLLKLPRLLCPYKHREMLNPPFYV